MHPMILRRLILPALAVLLAGGPGTGQGGQEEPLARLRVATADPLGLAAELERAGYDVLGVAKDGSGLEVVASEREWRALERRGLEVQLVAVGRPWPEVEAAEPSPEAVPSGYPDLAEVERRLQEIAGAHPAIAAVVDLTARYGTPPTFEGRHLFALKISDNVELDEDEPTALIVATHHAREIVTPVVALDAAQRLTDGFGRDSRITALVSGLEIWVAPVWNPDGYNHVFTRDNLWRKNRRVFAAGVGVDQNRNYPQGWNAPCAGSTSVSSDTFKGPSPASEAETQTMMAWSRDRHFAKVADFHSSGRQTLFAYRCLSHPFTDWMRQEATAISQASSYGGAVRLPSAEGEEEEWQFAQMGAYAFLTETHTEFQPPFASALNEAARVFPGILSVLERGVPLSGHVRDALTGAPLAAAVELQNVSFPNGESNRSGGPHGRYQFFGPPGTYDFRFSAAGHQPVVRRVTLTAASAVALDVALAPSAAAEVFADDFETDRGWRPNAGGGDTAVTGRWERGRPEATDSSGPKQLGQATSGVNDLVTGRLAGASAGDNDVDGGITSVTSPAIALPSSGDLALSFNFYLAHRSNATSADFLRVRVVGATSATVFEQRGAAVNRDAAWAPATVSLNAFAGQTVRLVVEAADADTGSLLEAAIDDVRVVQR